MRYWEPEDHYEEIVMKTINGNIPLTVHWDSTYHCNLKCVHCYRVENEKRPELSTDEAVSLIDQLAEMDTLYLTLSGGEILTRPDFFDIASYAREKGFALKLLTNGTLITPEIADKIKQLEPLSVRMSLYGMRKETHEKVTGVEGSYDKTIDALKLLKDREIRIAINYPLMKQNVKEFDDMKRFIEDIGVGFAFDLTIISRDDGSREPLVFRLEEEDLVAFLSSGKRLPDWEPREFLPEDSLCNAGRNYMYISPYGLVYPCIVLRECCGDLRETSLREIWGDSSVFERMRTVKMCDLPKCMGCELLSYCTRCPGLALLEDGDMLGPSTAACQEARVRRLVTEGAANQVNSL